MSLNLEHHVESLLGISKELDKLWVSATTLEERARIGALCDTAWYLYSQAKWREIKK